MEQTREAQAETTALILAPFVVLLAIIFLLAAIF